MVISILTLLSNTRIRNKLNEAPIGTLWDESQTLLAQDFDCAGPIRAESALGNDVQKLHRFDLTGTA